MASRFRHGPQFYRAAVNPRISSRTAFRAGDSNMRHILNYTLAYIGAPFITTCGACSQLSTASVR